MKYPPPRSARSILAAVALLMTFSVNASAQQPDPAASDLEILGHGPIHEAFARPALSTAENTDLVKKKPPAPIEELPPDVKPEGDNVVWIPGYWAFDSERDDFIWVSGFWRNVPPTRVWVSGYWVAAGDAYRWVPGYWAAPAESQVYYPPPPALIAEAQPPALDNNSFYVSGIWIYRDNRYQWRPGYWAPYRPGWMWTQPHYSWTPGGYVFVDGYWDYDFDRRGVLFAPAYFGPGYWGANRYYRPAFALATDALFLSLFVRPNAGAYYFGDYYAPRYAGLGFTPWLNYRYYGRYNDPAWSYYAWRNRGTPRWDEQMRTQYAARERGEAPAPPRKFNPQAAPQPKAAQHANLVVPVQQLQTANNVKLRKVTKEEQEASQRGAAETRSLAQTRLEVERKIDAKQSRQQPVTAKLQLPQAAAVGAGASAPPPLPVTPKLDAKAVPPAAKGPPDAKGPPSPVPATPKGKEAVPTPKKEQTPKSPLPPVPVPQPKGKEPTPPPKTLPTPKGEPKTLPPVPKVTPPKAPPTPKVIPAPIPKPGPTGQGSKAGPPAPTPKVVPSPSLPPPGPTGQGSKAGPLPPTPKVVPTQPAPKALPLPPPSPPPAKSAPPNRKDLPAPPRVERPAAPPPAVELPKGKGKGKEKD